MCTTNPRQGEVSPTSPRQTSISAPSTGTAVHRPAPSPPTLPALPETDEELFHLYAETESERALKEIMKRYTPIIIRYFERNSATRSRAEDLTQEVFIRMVRNRASYDPTRRFSTWSKTITERIAINAARGASRSRVTTFTDLRNTAVDDEWGIDSADEDPLPDELAQQRERRAIIDSALGQVEERYRNPLKLHFLEGLTHTEAARRLGIPVGTAKSRTHHALEDLRRILERQGVASAIL